MASRIRALALWAFLPATAGSLAGCSSDPPAAPPLEAVPELPALPAAGTAGQAAGGASSGGAAGSSGAAGSAGASAGSGGGQGVGCAGAALCWDFEEGAIPAGFVANRDEFNGQLLVDTTRPHGGTYSLHAADLSGGTPGSDGGPKKSLTYALPANFGPILWGRAFVYTTPERPVSHAGLFSARYPPPGSGATALADLDWYEIASYQQEYIGIWHPPEPPGFPEWVLQSGTPLVLDAWTCLEWLFDGQNGQNAEAADPRVWLDGSELTWPVQFVFPLEDPKPVMEKVENFTLIETGVIMYQGLTTPTSWWIDDLAIGPERIGCN